MKNKARSCNFEQEFLKYNKIRLSTGRSKYARAYSHKYLLKKDIFPSLNEVRQKYTETLVSKYMALQ